MQLALQFTALTASRSGEIRGATWEEASDDFKDWIVHVERMKAGRAHRAPLSEDAQQTFLFDRHE